MSKYPTITEFLADLQLIWTNCKTYNQPDSPIYITAEKLEELSQKLIQKLKFGQNKENIEKMGEENEKSVPSFDEKFGFLDRIKKLPSENMSLFINEIKDICPKAIQVKDKKMNIQLDNLDKENLELLNKKLDEMMSAKNDINEEVHSENPENKSEENSLSS